VTSGQDLVADQIQEVQVEDDHLDEMDEKGDDTQVQFFELDVTCDIFIASLND